MVKNNDSMKAFKKAKKATTVLKLSAKTAGEGSSQVPPKKPVSDVSGPRRVVPPPPVSAVDPPRVSVTTSAHTSVPPSKKQRTVEPFDLDAPDFDAVGFVDQQIAPYGIVPLDDVSILRNLDFITRSGIKLAHMGAALFRTAQDVPVRATKAFMEEAKSEYDRMKGLKEELEVKVAKLEKDLEGEKIRATAMAASANLAEEMAQKHKESYVRTYREMVEFRERWESAKTDYAELQGHLVGSVTAAYENLKAQVRVLAPELDLSLFSLDNVVEDGKIVPDSLDDDEEVDPSPVPSTKASTALVSSAPATDVNQPGPDPDVQILNQTDGTVAAVPLATRPPSPSDAATADAPL